MTSHSETARQIVHIAMIGWAFLLRFLTWRQAAVCALIALLFNAFVLPRIGGRAILRPDDVRRGVPVGILLYPLSVLLLILAFRERLDLVAAAWAILAAGDGCATLAGRSVPRVPLPWNVDKTVAGSITFAAAGGIAAIWLCYWTQPALPQPAPALFITGAPIVAAVVAALVESLPVRLDDNLSVPLAAGATLWVLSLMDAAVVHAMLPGMTGRMLPAVLINVGFGAVAYLEDAVSRSGLVAGVLIGIVIYIGAGWEGWVMLVAAFAAATLTSKIGWQRKVTLGIAESREGRRGAGNALANCVVSAVAAIVAVTTPHQSAAWLALVAALTAGAADTVASEIGKAWGKRTFLVIGLRPAPPGTPGAMSLEGTIANVVAALALATLGATLGLIALSAILAVVVGALAGAFVESVLGATLEKPGILNNDLLNFITTAVAVAVTLAAGGGQ